MGRGTVQDGFARTSLNVSIDLIGKWIRQFWADPTNANPGQLCLDQKSVGTIPLKDMMISSTVGTVPVFVGNEFGGVFLNRAQDR